MDNAALDMSRIEAMDAPLPADDAIAGVLFKPLRSHGDSRGFFREVIRSTDPLFDGGTFAQWSHSRMEKNVVKAWHYHHLQTDWWYVALGRIETVLFDNRPESPTYKKMLRFELGDSAAAGGGSEAVVRIPPGVLHGCQVLTPEAHLFYITSRIYSPDDEGRFPYDSALVPHKWGENVIVSDNDRREFVPKNPRRRLSEG